MKLSIEIFLIFIVWYLTSVCATISTKLILHGQILNKEHLLIVQLLLSIVYLKIFGVAGILKLDISSAHIQGLKYLFVSMSIVYVFGFLLLQTGLQLVSVSFAVTCRGFEPVVTCLLSLIFLSENITTTQWFAVLLISIGVSFCAGADKSWNAIGLVVLFLCNVCFSLRSLVVKFMHKKTKTLQLESLTGPKIYYVTCIIGSILLISFTCIKFVWYGRSAGPKLLATQKPAWMLAEEEENKLQSNIPILALNSACFTLYNISSYILLGKIQLSFHAIGNSVRQVVVIFCSIFFLGSTLTIDNVFGIFCVASGAVCYKICKKTVASKEIVNGGNGGNGGNDGVQLMEV